MRAFTLRSRCLHTVRPSRTTLRAMAATTTEQTNLTAWVQKNGGSVAENQITVTRISGSGYGLRATSDIQPGDRLVVLPRQCQLTYDAEKDDPKLLKLIDQVPKELWGAKLGLQLLKQRVQGPESAFATYISELPIGFQGIPHFFSREGVATIQYPPVSEQVKKRCRWLFQFSQQLQKLPGTEDDPFVGYQVDLNALGWAFAAVTSRAFRVKGPSHPAAMLPLIDMANHSFEPNCEVLPDNSSKGAVALFAKKKITAGEELLLSYGNLPNDFLFMDYGFVVPNNPHDRITLRWDIEFLEAAAELGRAKGPDGAPLTKISMAPWKQRWLQEVGLAGPDANLEVALGGHHLMDQRLLAALRVVMATSEAEIQGLLADRLGDLHRPLSRNNESAVLRTATGMALVALGQFAHTLEYDQALLRNENPNEPGKPLEQHLTDDVRLAVQFRMLKKQQLSDVIQGLGKRVQEIKQDASLPATSAPAVKAKGQKPTAATNKGFGAGSKA